MEFPDLDEETLKLLFNEETEFQETEDNTVDIEFGLLDTNIVDNNKENRFQKISFDDIDNFLQQNENKNTQRKTKGDINLFLSFLTTKSETRSLEFIPPMERNEYLCQFLLSVRKKDGGEYYINRLVCK